MSPESLFVAFLAIAGLIVLVGALMAWYSRRALLEHRDQVKEILEEMRRLSEDEHRAQATDDESDRG